MRKDTNNICWRDRWLRRVERSLFATGALLTGFDSVMVDSVPRQSGLPRGTIGRAGAPPPPSVPLSMDALLWSYPSKSARPPQPPAAGERSTLSATPR